MDDNSVTTPAVISLNAAETGCHQVAVEVDGPVFSLDHASPAHFDAIADGNFGGEKAAFASP
eukprot:9458585-Karenia_brevis.AAC.1